ncbi:AAC(3) family N-acetyltransferase [Jeotgalibaca caeni]|uniref:AAC(3) family N-acetyltransferase n=1 Tax=Jeotgalibaca caeni TaxID=3028623 RepID=UPI00237D7C3A|nr:AAC(3) family N-acetyltransferase [Jeotgalibaca caeni]MDE1549233.1 AAC(3) family N-acetyltransferase [Jeotgalibaca caeni]
MDQKSVLFTQLADMGLSGNETVLIHSSYKSMGPIEGGPEAVLDYLMEYFADGLLVLPTHTWAYIHAKNPEFHVASSPTNVGILTELFRQREGVYRSYHPTHSVAAFGKDAATFVEGAEQFDTPCARGSAWGKLLDREAKILLVGVDLRRNTFIHGIEEWVDIPGRITDTQEELYVVRPDGTRISVPSRRHTPTSWSEHFWKVDEVLQETGAMWLGKLGEAEVRICDTVRLTEVLTEMLEAYPDLFSDNEPLREDQRHFFREEGNKEDTVKK